ncbi:uncharacterized protein LOC128396086 [Panonychus citri]|uniref:uncharacterized protein LOC128396086 n=1 Tax=Panonychus citri TaxID=50023 RepID=UPI002306E447|nr:uncharacterized protein LOC128396086 [Panonychus citri]
MMNLLTSYYVVFIVIISGIVDYIDCYSAGVKLKDVDSLVFKAGQFTFSRKGGHSEPQLKCLGGPVKCKHQPKLVKCYNQGIKGSGDSFRNINWRCEADLADGYSFDKIKVNCEPFDYSNDLVVKGSCGLEYVLDFDNDDDDDDDDDKDNGDKKDRIKRQKNIGNWITYLITRIPRKSAELFFRNIFSFVFFSAIVYLFFFGWPTLPRRRRSSSSTPPWNPDESTQSIPNNRSRFNRQDREESIWATIIKVILEFAFEKLLKAFIR